MTSMHLRLYGKVFFQAMSLMPYTYKDKRILIEFINYSYITNFRFNFKFNVTIRTKYYKSFPRIAANNLLCTFCSIYFARNNIKLIFF